MEFKKELDKIKQIKRRKEKEREQRKKKQEESIKKFWQKENKLIPKKRELYQKIKTWKENLIDDFDIFQIKNKIELNDTRWGHKKECYAGWSILELNKDSKLVYKAGYKSFGINKSFEINKKTYKKLTYRYLKKLYETIENKEVYKEILAYLKTTI